MVSKAWLEAWRKKWKRRRDEPPFPDELPGEFCVIEYQRDYERYVLIVDNESMSSYDLGNDIEFVLTQFKRWGRKPLLSKTLDLAREFGAAQAIFSDGRTIALFDRNDRRGNVVIRDDAMQQGTTYLPAL